MNKVKNTFLLLLLSALTGCVYHEIETVTLPETVLFQADLSQTFEDKCSSCHYGGRTPLNLNTENAYTELLEGGYVVANQSEESPLIEKINSGHPSSSTLSDYEIQIIELWINQGAKL